MDIVFVYIYVFLSSERKNSFKKNKESLELKDSLNHSLKESIGQNIKPTLQQHM